MSTVEIVRANAKDSYAFWKQIEKRAKKREFKARDEKWERELSRYKTVLDMTDLQIAAMQMVFK